MEAGMENKTNMAVEVGHPSRVAKNETWVWDVDEPEEAKQEIIHVLWHGAILG
jgi:hypothetical protein